MPSEKEELALFLAEVRRLALKQATRPIQRITIGKILESKGVVLVCNKRGGISISTKEGHA